MNNLSPLVSVIVSTYNPKTFLSEAIESILNQTYSNIEILLYNDGTNLEDSIRVITAIIEKYPQIIYIDSSTNNGLSYALNKCIDSAKGEYVLRMDDDDYSLPNRIQVQYDFLKSNLDCDYVGSSAYLFDDKVYGLINVPESPLMEDILQSRAFVHPSIMIRKKTLNDIGKYSVSSSVLRLEDMDLWVRLFKAGKKGKNIPTPLLLYRENLNSLSKRTIKFRIREYKYKITKSIEENLGFFFIIFMMFKSFFLILIPQRFYRLIRERNYRLKYADHLYSINDLALQIQYIIDKGS